MTDDILKTFEEHPKLKTGQNLIVGVSGIDGSGKSTLAAVRELGKVSVMAYHSQIRGEFIRRYSDRKFAYSDSSSRMINERNEKHRTLNTKFGYSEPDGSFGIGCRSHVDQEYKRQYDKIESSFRAVYDDQLPALYRWALESDMTVYEYLLIDNIRDDDLKALAERSTMQDDWQLRPSRMKASLMIDRWKEEHIIGEIQRLVEIESAHFQYATARCRKLLGLKPWNLTAQKAIFDYSKEWKSSLKIAFGNLTAA